MKGPVPTEVRAAEARDWDRLIGWTILLGLALRLLGACLRTDMVWPDEQFQTLEPASHAVYGFGVLTWEWQSGYRSWLVPGLYMPILLGLKALGIQGGPWALTLCRALNALVGAAALCAFARLLALRGLGAPARLGAVALLALAPVMALWHATTLSDTWAESVLWLLMPTLAALASGRSASLAIAGLGLGFVVAIRLQMAFWVGSYLLFLLASGPTRGLALRLGALAAAPILLSGLVLDWIGWGAPFRSLEQHWMVGFKIGVVNEGPFPVYPWHHYFTLIGEDLGPWLLGALVGAPLAATLGGTLRVRRRDLAVLLPSLAYVGGHMALGPKEARYLLPVYPALFYAFALGLEGLRGLLSRMAEPARAQGRGRLAAAGAGVSLAAVASAPALLERPTMFSPVDTAGLEALLWRELRAGSLVDPGRRPCVLLIGTHAVWTRGDLLAGRRLERLEREPGVLTDEELASCPYALTAQGREQAFLQRAGQGWQVLARGRAGQALLHRR